MLINKILNNQKGFSLAEVLISAAVVGIVSVGIMQALKVVGDSGHNQKKSLNINKLHKRIVTLLESSTICQNSFNGALAGGSINATGAVAGFAISNNQLGGNFTGIAISSARITNLVGAPIAKATLEIVYNKNPSDINKQVTGVSTLTRTSVINVRLNGSQVVDCSTGFLEYENLQESCEKTGGTWNVATRACDVNETTESVDNCNAMAYSNTQGAQLGTHNGTGCDADEAYCVDLGQCWDSATSTCNPCPPPTTSTSGSSSGGSTSGGTSSGNSSGASSGGSSSGTTTGASTPPPQGTWSINWSGQCNNSCQETGVAVCSNDNCSGLPNGCSSQNNCLRNGTGSTCAQLGSWSTPNWTPSSCTAGQAQTASISCDAKCGGSCGSAPENCSLSGSCSRACGATDSGNQNCSGGSGSGNTGCNDGSGTTTTGNTTGGGATQGYCYRTENFNAGCNTGQGQAEYPTTVECSPSNPCPASHRYDCGGGSGVFLEVSYTCN